MAARITGGGARLDRRAVARSLIADIAIMKQRVIWMLILLTAMIYQGMRSRRSYALFVTQNKMFSSIVSHVEFVWGNTFAENAIFFDDDVTKQQYHCDDCGICRTGGKENFFHCKSCGCCYSKLMEGAHNCVEKAMHHNCPVCFEYLFDSMREITALCCGHTIHLECAKEMEQHLRYTCPVCSKSICDMSSVWKKLDEEVASTVMPEIYQNKMVWILCNDCSVNSEVGFHIVAHKCPSCTSYNTRQIQGAPTSCSSVVM